LLNIFSLLCYDLYILVVYSDKVNKKSMATVEKIDLIFMLEAGSFKGGKFGTSTS
jgi:hypothetical protein